MSLNVVLGKLSALKMLSIATMMFSSLWVGCESSEQATHQDSDEQALTSFVGDQRTEAAPAIDTLRLAQLEAENGALRQKIGRLEQDNGMLSSRVADLESKIVSTTRAVEPARPATPAPSAPTPPPISSTGYEGATKAFGQKDYDSAIKMYDQLLGQGVSEDLADNCHYWIGESYYGKKNYKDAISHFEKVPGYKTSEKKADAYYMMGRCYEMMKDNAKAKAMYEKIVKDFPTSDKVKRAKQRWGQL